MRRENLTLLILSLVLFAGVVYGVRMIVLGGAHQVRLSSAPALTGQVSQALGTTSTGDLLVVNKDYILSSHYFNESDWAVVNIQPVNKDGKVQNGYMILKKNGGIFSVLYGPGTSISTTQLYTLPPDVVAYIQTHISVYNPVVGL